MGRRKSCRTRPHLPESKQTATEKKKKKTKKNKKKKTPTKKKKPKKIKKKKKKNRAQILKRFSGPFPNCTEHSEGEVKGGNLDRCQQKQGETE